LSKSKPSLGDPRPNPPHRPCPVYVRTLFARRCRYASRTTRRRVARAANPSPPRRFPSPAPVPSLCPVAPTLNTYASGFLPRKKNAIDPSLSLPPRASQLWKLRNRNIPPSPVLSVHADSIVKTTGWRTDEKRQSPSPLPRPRPLTQYSTRRCTNPRMHSHRSSSLRLLPGAPHRGFALAPRRGSVPLAFLANENAQFRADESTNVVSEI